jgi:hypothetical protein
MDYHTRIICDIAQGMSAKTYLELGIDDAHNIYDVSKYVPRCIGVDIRDGRRFHNFEFHQKTTDEFFGYFTEKVDIVFIDANHDFDFVQRDFVNACIVLKEHGVIFLHDTDPIDAHYLNSIYCSDSYRIIPWVRDNCPDWDIITIPISVTGLSIAKRKDDLRIKNYL